jgi:hypothetical protein
VASSSTGSRLPVELPSSRPLSQTRQQESTPSNRSTVRSASQPDGSRNPTRWSPVGFPVGTCGGSTGNG